MRRGLSLGVAASVAASLACAACGSSGGSSEDPNGPDGEADAAQATQDGAIPDLDAGPDTGADAKKDGPPLPTGYCAKLVPSPKFCDDFDDGELMGLWTANAVQSGTIDLDESNATSAPGSFLAQTKALTVGSASAGLRKTILPTVAVSRATLSFSAFLPVVNLTKGSVAIATLDVSTNHYFTLNLRDKDAVPAASLEEFVGGSMTRHVLTKLPPAGVWTRVTIDVNLTTGKAVVSFDAVKALDAEPIMAVPGSEATVRIGALYIEGPADAFKANFDDVVVDF